MDKYSCFEELSAHEARGADYEVRWRRGGSGIAVLSIHGGEIEPGTSEIAEAVAGAGHSFYTFRGIKKAGNLDLHIASTAFDEPCALEIAGRSETVISIHGCRGKEEFVHVGGLDSELRRCIGAKLRLGGFKARRGSWSFYPASAGRHPVCGKDPFRMETGLRGLDKHNICNRCRRGKGVQMEISQGLRARMFGSLSHGAGSPSGTFPWFIQAVQEAIESFKISIEAVAH